MNLAQKPLTDAELRAWQTQVTDAMRGRPFEQTAGYRETLQQIQKELERRAANKR